MSSISDARFRVPIEAIRRASRRVIVAVASIMLPLSSGCDGTSATDTAFEDAVRAAATDDRLVVASFTADWCGPCRVMEANAWSSERVATWIDEHAIRVRVDVDQRRDLAQQFEVRSIPVTVVVMGGREVARTVGGLDAPRLIEWLDGVRARHSLWTAEPRVPATKSTNEAQNADP